MSAEVEALVAERVRREGPLPFDEVVDLALYHPVHGFYGRGRGAGRDGRDFITSPEVGRLFGAVLARALDAWWGGLGQPDPFVVVEAGAGRGTLAASVRAAAPACGPALRYLLVERSDSLRRDQGARLPLEPAAFVLGPSPGADPDEGARTSPGSGPLFSSLAELPVGPFVGVVLANELLDNLPFRLLQRRRPPRTGDSLPPRTPKTVTSSGVGPARPGGPGSGWDEVRVGAGLAEILVPAAPDLAADADRLAPEAPEGGRIPLQRAAAAWLRAATGCLRRGRVVVFDYGAATAAMAARPWTEWVRTYRAHGRGSHPLADLGDQDVTCVVATDQLAAARPPVGERSQAEFLDAWGLEDLVEEARRTWRERAAIGDLAALSARSRVSEADALTDPAGLGSFRVVEWEVP